MTALELQKRLITAIDSCGPQSVIVGLRDALLAKYNHAVVCPVQCTSASEIEEYKLTLHAIEQAIGVLEQKGE